MFCESCGTFIPDGQSFCTNCGAPVASPAPVAAAAPVAAPVAEPAPAPAAAPAPAPAPAAQPFAQPVATPVQPAQPLYQTPAPQPVQPVYQQPVYQPVYQPIAQQVQVQPAKPGNGAATAGLVFGILTLVFCWTSYFCGIFALLGLIFSIVGICKKNASGKGKAIAGLIMTIVGGIIAAFLTLTFWAAVGEIWDEEWDAAMATYDDVYSTSYSNTGDSETFYIDGDFVSTENGYVTGVLKTGGYIVEF